MDSPETGKHVQFQDFTTKILPELSYHIAAMLPIKALFRATLVCRSWRSLFLGFPRLWSCVRVAFGGFWVDDEQNEQRPQRPDLWQPLLHAYLERSQGLPLTIYISIGDDFSDPNGPELAGVSALLQANMHRVRALSATFRPPEQSPNTLPTYFYVRAPILQSFSLRARSFFTGMSIQGLFANDAPHLDDVELVGHISLVGKPLLAFPTITKLCYKGDDALIAGDLLAQLPSLQRLTLDTNAAGLSRLRPYERPIDVQIRVQKAWDASRLFPRARYVYYALGRPHAQNDWDVSKANLSVTLKRMAHRSVKHLDMRLSRLCVRPAAGTDFDVVRMTVKADGAVVAVDLDWIRQTPLIVSMLNLGALETLVLHEGIWEDLMDLELPRLRELTVQLRRTLEWWPLKRPRTSRAPWALAVLRLARSRALEEPGSVPGLKAADVATLVVRNFEPAALERVVLRGWELAEPGVAALRALALIRYEDEIACDDWVRPAGWPTRYIEADGLQV